MPVSLSIKLQGSACNVIKNEILALVIYCELCEIFKNSFFTEHLELAFMLPQWITYIKLQKTQFERKCSK